MAIMMDPSRQYWDRPRPIVTPARNRDVSMLEDVREISTT